MTNTEINSLLPENLQDKSSLALEQIAKEYFDIDVKPVLILTLENAKDGFLPFLAEMFHCLGYEGYKDAETREQKIKILKKSIYAHRKKGTVSAIKNLISASGVNAVYSNWNEFEGRPHSYILNINFTDEAVNKENIHLLLKRINEYKQLRANPQTIIIIDNKITNYYCNFAFCLGQNFVLDFTNNRKEG